MQRARFPARATEPEVMRVSRRNKRKYSLPVICQECGSTHVVARQAADRVLIHCEECGARIFAYYLDRKRQRDEEPPDGEDRFLILQVERDLLRTVGKKAAALYEYLRRYMAEHGYAPTQREMQLAFGWHSASAARHHLDQLEAVGLIERDFGEPRGIRLVLVA